MTEKRLLSGIAVMVLVLAGISAQAQAGISLGSAQGSKYAIIEQGGNTSFRLFFFNIHQEEGIEIYTNVQSDGGLMVEIDQERLTIPYAEPGRYTEGEPGFAYLSTPKGVVKAKPVTVRVSSLLSAEPGEHDIVVSAVTERQEGTIGTVQTRKFYFTVKVEGKESIELEEDIKTVLGEQPDMPGESPEKPPEDGKDQNPEEDTGGIARTVREAMDSITGAVSVMPAFGPFVLIGVVVLFIALRHLKKI